MNLLEHTEAISIVVVVSERKYLTVPNIKGHKMGQIASQIMSCLQAQKQKQAGQGFGSCLYSNLAFDLLPQQQY